MADMTETCKVKGNPATFTSIPVLDLSLVESPASKPIFLSELREALVMVGFFYLKNTSVSAEVQKTFVQKSKEFFELPLEKKLEIDMVNSKHFLGYSRLGCERTARKTDHREMIDVSNSSLFLSVLVHTYIGGLNFVLSSLHRSPLQVRMSRYISTFRARIR